MKVSMPDIKDVLSELVTCYIVDRTEHQLKERGYDNISPCYKRDIACSACEKTEIVLTDFFDEMWAAISSITDCVAYDIEHEGDDDE